MIDFGIIAAGDGNRIKEEGSILPKPLLEIQDKPMIGRLISLMEDCGANSISIIVNSDMPDVAEYLDTLRGHLECGLKVALRKTESSMHTMHELLKLMQPQDKFIVTTVDTIFHGEDFFPYVNEFKKDSFSLDGLMGVTDFIDDEKPLYVDVDSKMQITGYLDIPHDNIRYVSAGIYGLRPSAIPVLEECVAKGVTRMRNFQRALIENGLKLDAYNLGKVIDVDHFSDIEKADIFLTH